MAVPQFSFPDSRVGEGEHKNYLYLLSCVQLLTRYYTIIYRVFYYCQL